MVSAAVRVSKGAQQAKQSVVGLWGRPCSYMPTDMLTILVAIQLATIVLNAMWFPSNILT